MDDELVVDVGFGVFIGRVARVPGLDDVPRGFGDGEVEAVYAGERGGEVSRVVLDCVGWAWVGLGEGKKTLLTLSCRWPGTGWRSRAGWHLRCSTLWCWPMVMRCLPKGDAAGQFRPHHALPEDRSSVFRTLAGMSCLARRALRLGSLSPARQSVWLCARASQHRIRTYATRSNGSGEKVDIFKIQRAPTTTSFDRLLSLLPLVQGGKKPLGKDDMALLIAALFSSTDNQDELAKVAELIPPLIESYNKTELYARVSELMAKDLEVDKVEEKLRTRLGSKRGMFVLFSLVAET